MSDAKEIFQAAAALGLRNNKPETLTTIVQGINQSIVDFIESDATVVPGSIRINNIISLTQAQYNAITPDQNTFYIIRA